MILKEREYEINRPGCKVKYWLSGNSEKPFIFFAHGALVDHAQFDLQMHLLSEDYQIIRWDMRGHGKSRPLEINFSIKDASDDMLNILDVHGISKPILIGQSSGTYVIQEFAFQHPERVRAMIMIDGTRITEKLSIVESRAVKISPFMFKLWPYENLKKAMVNASAIKTDTKEYLKEKFNELSKEEFINIWTGLSNCIHYEPDYHVKSPLLLVYGEYDKTGNIKKAMKEWSERDKQSKYFVIPNAGHCSNQDNPKFFNHILLEFLDELNDEMA
jgi:pimeloyl-ACP methyl ester carboxylesterase